MVKEFCKCGHAKKYHIIGEIENMCCVEWASRQTGFIVGCECKKYEQEEVKQQLHKNIEGVNNENK